MTSLHTKRFRLGVVALCALFFTAGCDFNAAQEAFDNLAIVLELDDIETTASGQIVDAATGELLEGTATLSFSGPNGGNIVDFYNDRVSSLKTRGGLISFGLENDLTPSPSAPAEFTVTATAEGYLPGSARVAVTSDGGQTPFVIFMMSRSPQRAPAGTTSSTNAEGQASNSGSLGSKLDLDVDDTRSGASVDLAIPAGTVLKTADGRALSGQLSSTLTYYNSDARAALLALPQGYNRSADGTDVMLAFATNLLITDEDGNIATRASATAKRMAGAAMTIEVDPTLANPVTGATVAAGDVLTLLYWNGETSGEWEQVTDSETVTVAEMDGKLVVQVDVPVLGAYAFGFPLAGTVSCDVDGSFSVGTNGRSGNFQVSLAGTGFASTQVIMSSGGTLSGDFSTVFGLDSSADGANFSLTISQGAARSTVQGVNVCGGETTAALPALPASATDVRLSVTPICSASGQEARVTSIPATTIFYRRSDAPAGTFWTNGSSPTWETDNDDAPTYLVRGFLDLDQIATGVTYDFYTTYDGSRYTERDVLVPASGAEEDGRRLVNFDVDADDVCS